jgi:hypothetical protein
MTKRPDQHQLDQDDSGASDYKWRRKSEEGVDRQTDSDDLPANQATTQTPNEAMESSRQASKEGREDELERAREARRGNMEKGDREPKDDD